jgi:hypothetical protein
MCMIYMQMLKSDTGTGLGLSTVPKDNQNNELELIIYGYSGITAKAEQH